MRYKTMIGILLICGIAVASARTQAPTGTIAGIVLDKTGAAISAAHVEITDPRTGLKRSLVADSGGDYSAPALPTASYTVTAQAPGFNSVACHAIVEAGNTTIVNFSLGVSPVTETVTVGAVSPQMHYDSYDISAVVTGREVEGLPLNGRNFLELAKLEPGVQPPARGSNNRSFVPVLGAPTSNNNGAKTRVTVDGGSIMEVGNGGVAMGFSQEVVQEFQVSSANFDLSTGATASGAVNVVTRSGTNQVHGSAFLFFRDHTLSAYPGLIRDPSNPDPFSQRRQFGFALGGPLRKGRAFFFATFERNEQRGVISTQLLSPDFVPLSRITADPTYINQFSIRGDLSLSSGHSLFLRHSHEDIATFGPTLLTAALDRAYPSGWARQPGWSDQSILGVTTELRPNLINDLRFSYFFTSSGQQPARQEDCPGCIGIGSPAITVAPDLFLGNSNQSIATVLARRFHLNDFADWQIGRHRLGFGGDWETTRGGLTTIANEPVTMTLFSPQNVRNFNLLPSTPPSGRIPLPASFLTLQDILQLPLQSFTIGIGDPQVPQRDFGKTRIVPLVHLFFKDAWRVHSRFMVNYGLGWTYEAPMNYDLAKPAYLAPLLGEQGLRPTRRNWKNFSPSAGFAWSPMANGKTVIRGGFGIYYDFQPPFMADAERVSLGPRGVGRGTYAGSGIENPLQPGTFLNFIKPTLFTGASLLQLLPAIRADLEKLRGDPNNRDFSVTNIEVDKQGTAIASHLPALSSTQASIGVQYEIARGFVVTADFAYRRFAHIGDFRGPIPDLNHFASARGPVLPLCIGAQRNDPAASCSSGPIFAVSATGTARYQGLLLRAEKRLSHSWQLLGSYAYSSNVGNSFANGYNNDDPLQNYGPLDRDFRHILNLSGLVQLPMRFQLAGVLSYNSKPPFTAFLGSSDLNGDGTIGDLLPGTTVNQFNRGLGKNDLRHLVSEFNSTYAGKLDPKGRIIAPIPPLPANFELGDRFLTHDLRLSREFVLGERWHLILIGEVFNVFNIANLSGRSGDLQAPGFGLPTSRVSQVFGSGGPRSFQLAARASF